MEPDRLTVVVVAQATDPGKDALPVKVIVTNASDAPQLLNSRLAVNHRVSRGELYFDVEDGEGRRYELQGFGRPRALGDDDFAVVPPGQSIETALTLGDCYGLKRPGTYRVAVTYRNDQAWARDDFTAWRGAASSETITVRLS